MGVHIEMGKKHGSFSLYKQGFQFSDNMGDGFMSGCCACLLDHAFIDARVYVPRLFKDFQFLGIERSQPAFFPEKIGNQSGKFVEWPWT
jgi:hypothetical protein